MRTPLPTLDVLDSITIPTHCSVPWNEMEGDERSRFCANCQHSVYDVSELTSAESLELLTNGGKTPCLRIYRREDGRVLTADCTTKRERVWKWLRRHSALAASLFAVLFLSGCRTATQGKMIVDSVAAREKMHEPSESPKPPAP